MYIHTIGRITKRISLNISKLKILSIFIRVHMESHYLRHKPRGFQIWVSASAIKYS
jgi:hypothetical protein